jgi:hypothetical protein
MKESKRLLKRNNEGLVEYTYDGYFDEKAEKAEDAKVFEKLCDLEDKIENGTLVDLPCKVGDTIYEFFKYHKPPFIQQTKVEKIIITEKGLKLKLARNSVYETSIASLGKTLFLTETEAEARLQELLKENPQK